VSATLRGASSARDTAIVLTAGTVADSGCPFQSMPPATAMPSAKLAAA
jgi:hypothetical protein